jgi:hypothetical protein
MRLKNFFLCEAATRHPDNTFSALRGGLDSLSFASLDQAVRISLIATIEMDISERGKVHQAEMTLLDMDGKDILPPLRMNFQSTTGNTRQRYNVIGEILIKFPSFGEYYFYINVDGHELGSQSIAVTKAAV